MSNKSLVNVSLRHVHCMTALLAPADGHPSPDVHRPNRPVLEFSAVEITLRLPMALADLNFNKGQDFASEIWRK